MTGNDWDTNLQYPYALNEVDDIISTGEAPRGRGYRCIACGRPMQLRRGGQRRAHFAHIAEAHNCSPETVLHQLAKDAIKQGIEAALMEQRAYPFEWDCPICMARNQGDLAITPRTICVEETINGIRPDLLAVGPSGNHLVAIEVVVTHDPETTALQIYRQLDLPVVLVEPTWETIGGLKEGLTNVTVKVYNGPCRSPGHPPPSQPPLRCPRCQQGMQQVKLEVWSGYQCYHCKRPVPVLDIPERALWDDGYAGLVGPARNLGVRLGSRYSQTAGQRYLMHLCPHCGAKQGDFYIHAERYAEWMPDPDHPVRIGYYWWCEACDQWLKQEIREWKE
jgi:hypothetical protein